MRFFSIFFVFISVGVVFWTGCAPRDPQVLTPEERNKPFRKNNKNGNEDSNSGGNGSGSGNAAKIEVPDDVDQKIFQFQIERKNQILEQIQWVENIRNNMTEQGCIRATKTKETVADKVPPTMVSSDLISYEYRISFENCQTLPPPAVNVRMSGSLNLKVLFNIKTQDWLTAEYSANELSPLTYSFVNRPLNQYVNIVENQNLVIEKNTTSNRVIIKSFESKLLGHGKLNNNDFDITVSSSGGSGSIFFKNPEQILIPNTQKSKEIIGEFDFRLFTKYESAPANSYSSLQVSQTLFIKKDSEKFFKANTTNGWQYCFLDNSSGTLKLEFGKKSKTLDSKSNQTETDCSNKTANKGIDAVFGFKLFGQEPNSK